MRSIRVRSSRDDRRRTPISGAPSSTTCWTCACCSRARPPSAAACAWHRAAGSPTLLQLIETVWLKVGPLSERLFEPAPAAPVLNDSHGDLLAALKARDGPAARRAIERDLFVAAQYLRLACRPLHIAIGKGQRQDDKGTTLR